MDENILKKINELINFWTLFFKNYTFDIRNSCLSCV